MKTIQRTLLVSIVPLLTPMSALAQTGTQTERGYHADRTNSAQVRQGNTPSWLASSVLGKDVKNAASENIGEVEDLVVDMENGEVIAVIISTGGFLGLGESLSAVPVAVLRYDEQAKGFKTKLTKEQLGRAPQFQPDSWPDYSDASSSEVLRQFRATLNGDTNAHDTTTQTRRGAAQTDRDATQTRRGAAQTDRDATQTDHGATQTDRGATSGDTIPGGSGSIEQRQQREKEMNEHTENAKNQGDSPKDLEMTQDIRSDLMDTDLSSSAKNITVISNDEKVTLKGEVESSDEKEKIMEIAEKHCDKSKITDELEVKSN